MFYWLLFSNFVIIFLIKIKFKFITKNQYMSIIFPPAASMILITLFCYEILFKDRIPSTFGAAIFVHLIIGFIFSIIIEGVLYFFNKDNY